MTTDEEDYAAFLQGDNRGFERLVLKYKDGLIFYINRVVRNPAEAEELAQDAFVEVYVHRERFSPGRAAFKTYLYAIGHHRAVDCLRKRNRELLTDFDREDYELFLECAPEDVPERAFLEKERTQELYAALNALKSEYQQVLVLTLFEGMSLKRTAQVMGKTEPQAKVLAYRARRALAKRLEGKDRELS